MQADGGYIGIYFADEHDRVSERLRIPPKATHIRDQGGDEALSTFYLGSYPSPPSLPPLAINVAGTILREKQQDITVPSYFLPQSQGSPT